MKDGKIYKTTLSGDQGKLVPVNLQAAVTEFQNSPSAEEALYIMSQSYDRLGLTQLRDDADRVLRSSFPNTQVYANGLGNKKTPWWKPW